MFTPNVSWTDTEITVNVADEIQSRRKSAQTMLIGGICLLLFMLLGILFIILAVMIKRSTDEEIFNRIKNQWSTTAKNKNMSIRFVNFPDSLKHLEGNNSFFPGVNNSTISQDKVPDKSNSEIDQKPEANDSIDVSDTKISNGALHADKILGIVGIVIGAIIILAFSWFQVNIWLQVALIVICIVGIILSAISLKNENKIFGILGLSLCILASIIQIIRLIFTIILLAG
jgi:hypothetical protein